MHPVEGECRVAVDSAGPLRPAQGALLGEPLAAWRTRMRRELPLPDADVSAGAGHQAELWHPGILAKFVWADELARRVATRDGSAAVVHLLVDTDTRDPLALRAPVLDAGVLRAAHHTYAGHVRAHGLARDAAAVARPPAATAHPFVPTHGFALPSVAEGVKRLEVVLESAATAPNAAVQAWRALAACLRPVPGLAAAGDWRTAEPVRTSALLRTSLGEALLDLASRDPDACAAAFNRALELVPRAARPLGSLGPAGVEVPFWHISAAGARLRVGARELPSLRAAGALLVPRAFLTSAIARAALCDRFVHGTGGQRYELATNAFMSHWLGATLPAFDAATATLLLPFPASGAPAGITRAARRRAWFDPDAGVQPMSAAKRALLAEIAAAPRRSAARRAAWRSLQAWTERARREHAEMLRALQEHADADQAASAAAEIRADRTWPTPLHPAVTLARMAERLRALP